MAPLVTAVGKRSIEISELLLTSGADVEQVDWRHQTPLATAADMGYFEMALLLIGHGAGKANRGEATLPIVFAAIRGDIPMVKLLLEHGAHPNDVLQSASVSLFRIEGDVLRLLVAAGGSAPPDIVAMLEARAARGDRDYCAEANP